MKTPICQHQECYEGRVETTSPLPPLKNRVNYSLHLVCYFSSCARMSLCCPNGSTNIFRMKHTYTLNILDGQHLFSRLNKTMEYSLSLLFLFIFTLYCCAGNKVVKSLPSNIPQRVLLTSLITLCTTNFS